MSCGTSDLEAQAQDQRIESFLQNVKHKFLVMSGKGGVGKSTVATNLAVFLSNAGYNVGLLDVDVHGPSVAGMLGMTGLQLKFIGNQMQPYLYTENLKVISIQGLLEQPDQPLIWRGPVKIGIIRQFLGDVNWGPLDYLIIDSPPGTGDEPLTVAQTIPGCEAIIVTTPQEISLADVRKSLEFCKTVNMNVLGVIENMSGFVCPNCGTMHEIFKSGGGEKTAAKWDVPFLGRLPIDPVVVLAGDEGKPIDSSDSQIAKGMREVVEAILKQQHNEVATASMKIAIPLANGKLCAHFGHCQQFAIITLEDGKIINQETLTPPPHAPGVIPNWVADQGCTNIIVGGMGESAQQILGGRGVSVTCGAPTETPEKLVRLLLAGQLVDSSNSCDHDHEDHHCGQ